MFLYKNGFRINPFGNPDDDNLGIDRRHQQGFYRTLEPAICPVVLK